MNFTTPFTSDSILSELSGQVIVSRHCLGNPEVSDFRSLNLGDGNWKITDGVLELFDEKGHLQHRINGVEFENNISYLVGEDYCSSSLDGFSRTILHNARRLGDDFAIGISSHVDYEEFTMSRILRSLAREGISEDRIYKVVANNSKLMGFSALEPIIEGNIIPSEHYLLLLHDTSEVFPGFVDAARQIDVGLPYDFIGIASKSGAMSEIGFWSVGFLQQQKMNLDISYQKLMNSFKNSFHLSRYLGCPKEIRAKDVYGTGTSRQVVELGLGIKKYLGPRITGGCP